MPLHADSIASVGGRTHKAENRMSQVPVQEPPTQGHDRDMGTSPNTAAIYVRRSAFDAEAKAEAFSRSLTAPERECLAWAERQGCL